MNKILPVISIMVFLWIGHALAESAAQDAIPIRFKAYNEWIGQGCANSWSTTSCGNYCNLAQTLDKQADCRVQCTEILTEMNKMDSDLNGINGVFWANDTNDT